MSPNPLFTVSVAKYEESSGISFHVVITNNLQRPHGCSPFDDTGRIAPFHSPREEEARHEAKEWAMFLGYPEQAICDCIMCTPTRIKGEQNENS